MFPRGSTLSINYPFWKNSLIWRYNILYPDKPRHPFLENICIKRHRFRDIFDNLVGKVIKTCRPAGKHVILSGPSSATEIIVEIYTDVKKKRLI